MKTIKRIYHYLYYCYYNLVSSKASHREHGASSLLTVLMASIIIATANFLSIALERKNFMPAVEGFGIFFLGILVGVLNWIYFIKKKKYEEAINEFPNVPKYITITLGVILVGLPFCLFMFSGIKLGAYVRSIK